MEAYRSFAEVYDIFMDNVPYDTWQKNIVSILEKYHIKDGLVAELGCGTGKMTRRLSKSGFDMIGIDNSDDMLSIAIAENEDGKILYLCQDMQAFELYGTVKAVVSVCDSMNYITSERELLEVFRLVNNYLDPHGIFLFDMNTIYKYEHLLGENTFAENRPQGSFVWENYYDSKSGMNEYDLTLYIREDATTTQKQHGQQVYHRYEEVHFQKAYEMARVEELLEQAGLEFMGVIDGDTLEAPRENTERVYYIARECTKGKDE